MTDSPPGARGPVAHRVLVPVLVGAGLLAGFVREILLAALFGISLQVEIYRVATGIPGVLGDSVAVSVVSVFIPMMLLDGRVSADRGARVFKLALLLAGGVFVLGAVTMWLQAVALAPGIVGEGRAQLVRVGLVCWVGFLFGFLSLAYRAELSLRDILWPGAAHQVLKSVAILGSLTLILVGVVPAVAMVPAVGFALGALLILLVHAHAAGRRGRALVRRTVVRWRATVIPPSALAALGALFIAQLLWNAGRLIDRAVASNFPQGSLASLEFSYALVMALGALIGTSVNLIVAPLVGKSVSARGVFPPFLPRVVIGVSLVALVVGFLVRANASALVSIIFEHGAFDAAASAATAELLRIQVVGLAPLVAALLMTQLVILRDRTRWLIPVSIVKLIAKVAALLLLLEIGLGLRGVAWTLVISEIAAAVALAVALPRLNRTSQPTW